MTQHERLVCFEVLRASASEAFVAKLAAHRTTEEMTPDEQRTGDDAAGTLDALIVQARVLLQRKTEQGEK